VNLKTYIEDKHIDRDELRIKLNVSSGMIGQWLSGHRKVTPKKCVAIEKLSGGKVTRKDLRPDDFEEIWPELVVISHAIDAGKTQATMNN